MSLSFLNNEMIMSLIQAAQMQMTVLWIKSSLLTR